MDRIFRISLNYKFLLLILNIQSIMIGQQKKMYQLIFDRPQWNQWIEKELHQLSINLKSKKQLQQSLTKFTLATNQYFTKRQIQFSQLMQIDQKRLLNVFSKIAKFVLNYHKQYINQKNISQIPLILNLVDQTQINILFQKNKIVMLMCLMALTLTLTQFAQQQQYQINQVQKQQNQVNNHKQQNQVNTDSQQKQIEQTKECYYQQQQQQSNQYYQEQQYEQNQINTKTGRSLNFGQINFIYIFQYSAIKTEALIQYFQLIFQNPQQFQQFLQIKRSKSALNSLTPFLTSKSKLSNIQLAPKNASIEDYYGSIKIDFANSYIGGGSLITGMLQQQIMFFTHPELYITMILCQKMYDDETLSFIGFKKYFQSQGYASNVKLVGLNKYKYELDEKNIAKQYIVGMDALCFPQNQYCQESLKRELIKSHTGFKSIDIMSICSGNWGCGAFGGDAQLKFLLQWISASMVNKSLIYCRFGNEELKQAQKIVNGLKDMNIGDLTKIIKSYDQNGKGKIFNYISKNLKKKIK